VDKEIMGAFLRWMESRQPGAKAARRTLRAHFVVGRPVQYLNEGLLPLQRGQRSGPEELAERAVVRGVEPTIEVRKTCVTQVRNRLLLSSVDTFRRHDDRRDHPL
jgi:hypothetical protein